MSIEVFAYLTGLDSINRVPDGPAY